MSIILGKNTCEINESIILPASKSISNRLLICQYHNPNINLINLSQSDDTLILKNILYNIDTNSVFNVGNAGTSLRFLVSLLINKNSGEYIINCSNEMKNRQINDLVDIFNEKRKNIFYLEKENFPPLKIIGTGFNSDFFEINSNISSQFISSLLLNFGFTNKKLTIKLKNSISSISYINMTLKLLERIGFEYSFEKDKITLINNMKIENNYQFIIENDWSSASYFYSYISYQNIGTQLILRNLNLNSIQGDSVISNIFDEYFGVKSIQLDNDIVIKKEKKCSEYLEYDFYSIPDMVQTIVCACVANKITFKLLGVENLKHKETNRILALQNELLKLNLKLNHTDNCLIMNDYSSIFTSSVTIDTYNDHRMAMSFASIFAIFDELKINDSYVVKKSFPGFWENFTNIT